MIETRLEFKIGSRVVATDGASGYIQQIIVDPQTNRIAALIVRTGLLADYPVVVPIDQIVDATDDEVRLKIDRAQVAALPGFDPDDYAPLSGGHRGHLIAKIKTAIHSSEIAQFDQMMAINRPLFTLQAGQLVHGLDGHVGHIALLLSDREGKTRHFVLQRGHLHGRRVIVPVVWVRHINEQGVHLSVDRQALDDLPEYDPDRAIAFEVDHALWSNTLLRESDYATIDVAVKDGVVTLTGHVQTSPIRAQAERVTLGVPGVLRVEDQIIVDDELITLVAQALADDGRTRGQTIYVYAHHGFITLVGEVQDASIRAAAEEIAASLPPVRAVVNRIDAPGVVIDADSDRVLQPRVKQAVYASDMQLGQVDRVIINPHNRRVIAYVVDGQFPDLADADPNVRSIDMPQLDRTIVFPIDTVQHLSEGGVLLNMTSLEAARYPDFDAANFSAPPADWQPPYPYRLADVLFDSSAVPETDKSRRQAEQEVVA